jgi:hypothetical protein
MISPRNQNSSDKKDQIMQTRIRVRNMSYEELETLIYWERADNVLGYIRARILRLSQDGWECPEIATAMGLDVDSVRKVIINFNRGGIATIAPRPHV